MAKFRKKPVVVEAFQMTEKNRWDMSGWPDWMHKAWNKGSGEGAIMLDPNAPIDEVYKARTRLMCVTLEGNQQIDWKDWIIKGVKGEIYPCKPEIFQATYDMAEPDEPITQLAPPVEQCDPVADAQCAQAEFPDTTAPEATQAEDTAEG